MLHPGRRESDGVPPLFVHRRRSRHQTRAGLARKRLYAAGKNRRAGRRLIRLLSTGRLSPASGELGRRPL
jgi:hypothetical protein